MTSKNILASKTFWLNTGLMVFTAALPGLQQYIGNHPSVATAVFSVINILNRLLTTQPVTVLPQN